MRNVITGVGNLQRRRLGVYIGTRVLQCRGARIYSLTPQRRRHLVDRVLRSSKERI